MDNGASHDIPLPPEGRLEAVPQASDTLFTWDYAIQDPALLNLYEKGKRLQWNASTDIDWSISVDPEQFPDFLPPEAVNAVLNPPEHLEVKELVRMRVHQLGWMLSQFLHGEQGALLATAQIVNTVPWAEAKFYASSQVADEARHVEVYRRYLTEKLPYAYPVNPHLHTLLDQIIREPRWDMTYLGMQIMIEGLALAAFGFQYQTSPDPLLKQITRYVMADEARHVAFGVLSLQEACKDLTAREIRERQEFCYEAAVKMRDRFLGQEVWERAGLPVRECCEVMLTSPLQREFRKVLFSKIVPNLKKLGLLDAGDGWLRARFGELGVLQFEDWEDTGAEYERMQLEHAG